MIIRGNVWNNRLLPDLIPTIIIVFSSYFISRRSFIYDALSWNLNKVSITSLVSWKSESFRLFSEPSCHCKRYLFFWSFHSNSIMLLSSKWSNKFNCISDILYQCGKKLFLIWFFNPNLIIDPTNLNLSRVCHINLVYQIPYAWQGQYHRGRWQVAKDLACKI